MISLMSDASVLHLLLTVSFLTLLWPVFISDKSILHQAGVIIHIFIITFIVLCIFKAYAESNAGINIGMTISVVNELEIKLQINKLGMIFASIVSLLWPAAYMYSIGYLQSSKEGNNRRFLFFLNLSFCSVILLCLAQNLITLFICYEFLSISTIPLVAHTPTEHVIKSAKKYMFYLFGGSICLWLPSLLYIKFHTNFHEFMVGGIPGLKEFDHSLILVLFLMTLFGILKTAIFPLHSWLPAAMAANYPTSSVLHAVLVVNAGIYSLYKFTYEVFGKDVIQELILDYKFLIYLPVFGVIYSGIMSIMQETVKKALAWSTVSQLNMLILIAISSMELSNVLSYHNLIVHSFAKITLFFTAGCIYARTKATKLYEFRETIYNFKMVYVFFVLAGISLSGLPLFKSSFLKKLILATADQNDNIAVILGVISSSILSLIYIGRIVIEMSSSFEKNDQINHNLKYTSTSPLMVYSYSYTAILSLITSYLGNDLHIFLKNFLNS